MQVRLIQNAKSNIPLFDAIIKLHLFCLRRLSVKIADLLAFSLDFDLQAGSLNLLLELEIAPIIVVIPNETHSIKKFSKQSSQEFIVWTLFKP